MSDQSNVVEKARAYYDSSDADQFYFNIWGGEDIHIGLYKDDTEDIFAASRRTVERMAEKIAHLPAGARILDMGAGYGGSARFLAREKGYNVAALNLSVVQNDRDRQMNKEQGLADKIEVIDGSFEDVPFPDGEFDAVWSQDSILHSGNREKVFSEANRLLKPGGDFIFTDPMQKKGADPELLKPVLERIHLSSMGSIDDYVDFASKLGMETVEIDELHQYLPMHYQRVHDELERRDEEIRKFVSEDYITRMKKGLNHWVTVGRAGGLAWAILHFRKPR